MGMKPRDRLLQVANELFYTRGLHAVGIDEIIERSGAAKATLYAHFATKDHLITAYLQSRSDTWRAHMTAALEAKPRPPIERIDAMFQVLADACADVGFRGCPFFNAAAEYPDPRHPARLVGASHRQWICDLFRKAAKEAKLRRPDVLAEQLTLIYDAALVSSQLVGDTTPAERAREAARVLVQAARPSRPRRRRAS